jgi:hypothetical protein
MKNFILKTSKPILLFFLFFTSFAIAQTTHIVNNNTGTDADFTNLQAAIDAAVDGDIIHIQQSSTSYGNITLDKELTLIGRSHSDASYSSQVGTINLADGCSNSTIKGLQTGTITEPFVSGASHIIEDLVLQDNRISSISNLGIYGTFNNMLIQGNVIDSSIAIGQKTSNILITNNLINGSSISLSMVDTLLFTNNVLSYFNGVSISNNTSDLLNISNCIFVMDRAVDRTVFLSTSSGTIQVTNCITYNYNSPNNYTFATGANITLTNNQENIDPLFIDRATLGDGSFNPELYNLNLQGSSTVVDDGLYENYNFKPLGTPTGLPSIKIDTYSPTVPKNSNLTLTISAKTN